MVRVIFVADVKVYVFLEFRIEKFDAGRLTMIHRLSLHVAA